MIHALGMLLNFWKVFYGFCNVLQHHAVLHGKPFGILLFFNKGVQMTTRKKLCQIKGISEAKMEKIKVCVIFS